MKLYQKMTISPRNIAKLIKIQVEDVCKILGYDVETMDKKHREYCFYNHGQGDKILELRMEEYGLYLEWQEAPRELAEICKQLLVLGDDAFGLVVFDVGRVVAFFEDTAHQDHVGTREHVQKTAIDECIPVDTTEGHIVDGRVGRHKHKLAFSRHEIVVTK